MPTNAMIPLSLKGIDPESIPNAFLKGMKMSRYQQEGNAARRKEEAAQASTNALRTYGQSARGPEDLNTLWGTDPTTAAGIEKTRGAAALNTARIGTATAQAEKAQIEIKLKNLELGSRYLAGAEDEPSYQHGLEQSRAAGLDVSSAPSKYFPDWVEKKKQQALSTKDGYMLQLKKLDLESKIEYRDSMHGKPMVVQTPGGTYSYDPRDPQGTAQRMDTGPSSSEVATTARQEQGVQANERNLNKKNIDNQQKFRDFESNMKQLTDAADSLDADLAVHGTETDIPFVGSPEASVQKTRYADVMSGIQKVRDMGVLQPGEFPFLEMAVKNPTTFINSLQGSNVRAQLAELKAQTVRATARARTRFGDPRAPTMVPGSDSGYTYDQILNEQQRRASGSGPSPEFDMSDESLGQLAQAQTDKENGAPVTASPLPSTNLPKPVGMPAPTQKEFDAMPMPGEYTGKRMKTKEGLVYRSNGTQWVRE